MRYFDGMADACFKHDAQGRAIFFPSGVLSKGRIVPDEKLVGQIKTRLKRAYMIMVPLAVLLGASSYSLSLPAFFILMAILVLSFNAYLRHLASGLEISAERLSIGEAYFHQARALGRGWLIALSIICALFAVAGLALAFLDPGKEWWAGLGSAAFFAAMLALFLVQLHGLGRNGA